MHYQIIKSLRFHDEKEFANDGMDMIIIRINTLEKKLTAFYANQHGFLFLDRHFTKIERDPYAIGDPLAKKQSLTFNTQIFSFEKEAVLYLTSDGYYDQFGGEQGRKFTIGRFEKLLHEIYSLPAKEQKQILGNRLKEWMNGNKQLDDILVVGIRL